jgi:hypothetical protein
MRRGLALVLVLMIAGCGSESDTSPPVSEDAYETAFLTVTGWCLIPPPRRPLARLRSAENVLAQRSREHPDEITGVASGTSLPKYTALQAVAVGVEALDKCSRTEANRLSKASA